MVRAHRKTHAGFTLLEIVAALAVLAILGASVMPLLGKTTEREREQIVRRKLEAIRNALEEYHFQYRAFPSSLTTDVATSALDDSAFIGKFMPRGTSEGNSYTNDSLEDEFNPGSEFKSLLVSGNPEKVWIWSVGPNRTNDTRFGDDIWIQALEEIPGRRRTRLQLNIMAHAAAKKIASAGRATHAWSAAACTDATCQRVYFGLGHEFAVDGFGVAYVVARNASQQLITLFISYGPNQAINTGYNNNNVGTGDDMRE